MCSPIYLCVCAILSYYFLQAVYEDAEAEKSVEWGLDRIDQRNLPLDNAAYDHPTGGEGVAAFILDTGIRVSHQEFTPSGRAYTSSGWDYIGDGQNGNDCDGHGTHVGGTVAGNTVGVAPGANLVGVRILSCGGSGSYSGIIQALDDVAAACPQGSVSSGNLPASFQGKKCVSNMSLGGGFYEPLNAAVDSLRDSGTVVAVAAGNENTDACTKSPASVSDVLFYRFLA